MDRRDDVLEPMWALCERGHGSSTNAGVADAVDDPDPLQPPPPHPSDAPLLVWYCPSESAWAEVRCAGVSPCQGPAACRNRSDGDDDCDGNNNAVALGKHRSVCVAACDLVAFRDAATPVGTGGFAPPEGRACALTHRTYAARTFLLDEVAAYAAAVHLAQRFYAAFADRTKRYGGVTTSSRFRVVAAPSDLVFAGFVGVVDCGPRVPLRRVDSPVDVWLRSPDGADAAASDSAAAQRTRDMCAALSHYSWAVSSGHRAMVEVLSRNGVFVTVAAVHTNTSDPEDQATFGRHCNRQRPAIAAFLRDHRCNEVCRMLSLPPARPLV